MTSLFNVAVSGLEAFIYLGIVILLFVFLVRPVVEMLLAPPRRKPETSPRSGGPPLPAREEEVSFDHPRGGTPQAEVFERLAASDPEKAGALVKKWLQEKG